MTSRPRHIALVGHGMVGSRFTEEITRLDPDGTRVHLTAVGTEPGPAYNRILLPHVLAGHHTDHTIALPHTPADHVHIRTDTTATHLDPLARTLTLDEGTHLHYDELVLATGAHAHLPPVPGLRESDGTPGPGVSALRQAADCHRITSLLEPGAPAVVLGGGVLGLETARGLAQAGIRVHLVESSPWIMRRQIDRGAARILTRLYTDLGVQVHTWRVAARWIPGTGLELDDGHVLAADACIVTAGVAPTTDLAQQAGLATDHGIVVDDHLATSHPRVHAIGDCARHPGAPAGLVAPGWEQAAVLARRLTGTDPGATYTGTRPVTRLKATGIDLTAFGQVDTDPDHPDPDAGDTVTVTDPRTGRYGALTVTGDRIRGAVLLGFPEAAATLAQMYETGAPPPQDLLALLQGLPSALGHSQEEPEQDPLVCRCNAVHRSTIEDALDQGATDRDAVAARTRATTGCGGCTRQVQDLIDARPAPAAR
ncbi:NAD(P)/FAD-dependent oxidoreductase [Nocardiopsis sp. HNM0947]|uniref:NAD(P)/FAD-dependent oxidoreductase n=1 Tax=Nocardiopsis coralli TaxID=2772213 RepID=A0ABR9P6N0_9ACTN|nr:FAD-dependent oxidoreductase [Nocardiopsis coralli]MBE2999477.1 NAD(P)/FAD-dependent oxidoreductase [Nocardiopsis coralli]